MKRTLLKLIPVIAGVFIMGSSYGQCPTVTCPTNITVSNDSGACGAVVNYTAPVGVDLCGNDSAVYNFTGNIDTWTVPTGVTSVTIEVAGAEGGNNTSSNVSPGLGAYIVGDFNVTPGAVYSILVGEQPSTTAGNGGGGGSFVVDASNNPVIIAGGGGGSAQTTDSPNKHGQAGTTGGTGAAGGGTGGIAGSGGNIGSSGFQSGAGGGLLTNGTDGWTANTGGLSFLNGGTGGTANGSARGGFGGGGSGSSYVVGGAGGGYSGGGSGGNSSAGVGGGGASFNGGVNQTNTSGVNTGHGYVKIKWSAAVPTTQSSGLSSGSTFPIGTTVCEYIATNNFGSDTCSFTVTVVDTTKPTVTCPGDVTTCDNIVTNIAPSTTDNCTGETVAYTITGATTGSGTNDASGTSFNEGLSTVTYIVTDASGNQDSCSFTVEVQTSSSTISPVSCGSYTAPSGAVYTMSNTYMDTIPNSNMCDSVITINLTVVDVDVSTSLAGDTITSNDNDNGVTYQWLNCDSGYAVIAGATNQSYIAAVNGNYAVEVTENGCVDTSACVTIVHQGLGELFNKGISIYPNPTNGVVNIDMGRYQGLINYELVSVEGKVIQSVKGVSNKKIQIDLGKESKGIYLLKLYNAEGVGVHRIIKE